MTSYAFYPGGSAPGHFEPGNFLLTRTQFNWRNLGSLDGPVIRLGQRLRFPKKFSWPNHAAMVISDSGLLIEALAQGVCQGDAKDYKSLDYYLVDPYDDDKLVEDIYAARERSVEFCQYMLGTKYGFLDDVSLGFTFLTGCRFYFGRSDRAICSGLVAAAIGEDPWRADPSHVAPAELAQFYGVTFERSQ